MWPRRWAAAGLEQEIFLVPRDAYYKRPDLQFCGRTLLGRMPARGQELSDHYMAPPSSATAPLAFFREVQEQVCTGELERAQCVGVEGKPQFRRWCSVWKWGGTRGPGQEFQEHFSRLCLWLPDTPTDPLCCW